MTRLSTSLLAVLLSAIFAMSTLRADDKAPGARPIDAISHVQMPSLDRASLQLEDDTNSLEGKPPRYAVPHPVSITPDTGGTWDLLDPQTRLWRQRISSPGAASINIGFTQFRLPPGARLIVGSADGDYVLRPFNDGDNNIHNQLWTPPVAGDDIVVELTLPTVMLDRYQLEIGSINIGYRRFGDILDPQEIDTRSGSCNVDVACSTADPWRLQVKTVAVISTGGSTFCTGFMVNNTANDRRPYFMTANHCGVGSGNAASLVAFWNYENSTCRGIPGGGGVGNGQLNQFTTGATFRAAASVSDFTLVEFNNSPNPAYQVAFAGWDRNGLNPPRGACIHHPNTDEKRITLYDIDVRPDRPTHGSSWGCSAFPGPGDNTHIKAYWSLGVTEPGSSGSPLFDDNKRVIGQLHGGASACGQTGDNLSDCYGRVSRSWTGNGTPSTRLSDWLDSGNTGATFVDTIPSAGFVVTPNGNVTSVGVVGGPFTNPSTAYNVNNPGATPANYNISFLPGGTAPLLMNGGTGPLTGTLNGASSLNVTIDIDATAANALPAGVYSTTVRFSDTTNNVSTDRVHSIEIGQTNFTTTPTTGLETGGPQGGPFNGTQVYTLTSTQPTPVNSQIAANQSWITLNGGAGPINLSLNGTGDNQNVTVGIAASANSLAPGLYTGAVNFTNTSGGGGTTSRSVSLEIGRVTYTYSGPAIPINDFQTIESTINVVDNYTICDLDVRVDLTHTYIGDLIVEIISPIGTVVRLHNRTEGTTDNIHRLYTDGGVPPTTYPPSGPGVLANFNGQSVNGMWKLRISDNAGIDQGTLDSWYISVAPCPPPCASFTNADMNADGVIDGKDVQLFCDTFVNPSLMSTQQQCAADVDDDSDVDEFDLRLFARKVMGLI